MKWNLSKFVRQPIRRQPIRNTCKLGLEELESRWVPAVITPSYLHIVIDPNPSVGGSDTLEKALVDINGDGKLDAVLGEGQVNGGPGGLYWYQAPSSGNLSDPWIKHTIASSGNFYEGMTTFDVNGDGAPDIIASDNDQVIWFENPAGHGADPGAGPWVQHVMRSTGGAHAIVTADVDGDGKMDVILSGSGGLDSLSAILFQNSPTSWQEVRFGSIDEGATMLDIGSGKGSINIAGANGNSVLWFENPREHGGNARTDPWIQHLALTLPDAGEDALASGVFTTTGRMDLLIVSNEDMPANPTGLWRIVAPADRRGTWSIQTIDSTYQAAHQISVGDMNNDGILDFVTSEEEQAHNTGPGFNQNFNKQKVAVFYNDGNGNFTQQVIATTGSQNQVLGDIDGDGDLDILGANHGFYGAPHPLEIWVNQLNHTQPPPPPPNGNLVQDPGFENQGSTSLGAPWFAQGSATFGVDALPNGPPHSGSKDGTSYEDGPGTWSALKQTITITPNTNYTLTGWLANSDNAGFTGGEFGVVLANGTVAQIAVPAIGPAFSYQQETLTFNSGSNTSLTLFAGYTPGTGFSWMHLDDASLVANGQTPPPPPPPGNPIQNPGFETGALSPWIQEGNGSSGVDNNSQHAHSGTDSAALWSANGSADLAQNVAVTPNTNYLLTAWIDASNTTNGALAVRTTGGTVLSSTALVNTDPGPFTHQADFRQYTVSFNSGSNSSIVIYAGYKGTNSGFINLDDVTLTTSSINPVQNSGFELSNSLTGWSVQGTPDGAGIDNNPAHAHSGSNNAFIWDGSHRGQFVALTQTIILQANTNYTLTAWINASNTTGGTLGVRTTGGTVIKQGAFVNTDPGPTTNAAGYRQFTVSFNSGSTTQLVLFFGYTAPGSASYINLDDVTVLAS